MSNKNSKSARNRKSSSTAPAQKVSMPKKVEVQADHLKLLQEINGKERMARDALSLAYLRKSRLEQQINTITREELNPQEEEVYRQRKRFMEMGRSFMEFYDLIPKEGFVWQLTLDEGAWILVPIEEK